MSRVQDDQISGWYHACMSHNGRSNAYNWKDPFFALLPSTGQHGHSHLFMVSMTVHLSHKSICVQIYKSSIL